MVSVNEGTTNEQTRSKPPLLRPRDWPARAAAALQRIPSGRGVRASAGRRNRRQRRADIRDDGRGARRHPPGLPRADADHEHGGQRGMRSRAGLEADMTDDSTPVSAFLEAYRTNPALE